MLVPIGITYTIQCMLNEDQQCHVNFMLQTVFVRVVCYLLLYLMYMSMIFSECLNKSGVDGSMNHMLYADDICIISLSSSGLQRLLNICDDYCKLQDLIFNAKKSMCIYFSTTMNIHCGLPVIYLGNTSSVCQFVQEVKYLGYENYYRCCQTNS